MVDPWRVAPPGSSYFDSGDNLAKANRQEWDRRFMQAMRAIKPFRGRVIILPMTSEEAAPLVERMVGKVDHVFIDADHSREGVARDIEAWWPLCREWIGGHDYGNGPFPGVAEAVDAVFPNAEKADGLTWFEYREKR